MNSFCCDLCGGFIQTDHGSLPAHQICTVKVPQLVALAQHLSDRLSKFASKDIVRIPQLQKLVLRKFLIEKHIEAQQVQIVKQGHVIQGYEEREEVESDEEYAAFLNSLIEAQAVQEQTKESEAETDPPFPEEITLRTREPVEEYRDDAEVKITNDELMELFDVDEDSLTGSELFTVPAVKQEPLFTVSMFNEFVTQMRQNFQIVLQGVAISKEFVMPNLQTLDFWHTQYTEMVTKCSDKYALVKDLRLREQQIAWIPLLCEYKVECVEAVKMALATSTSQEFIEAIQCKWDAFGNEFNKENPRSKRAKLMSSLQLPFPRSLNVILNRLAKYLSEDLMPEWSAKPKTLYTRDVEDILLLQGLIEYGTNYQLIQEQMLPHRTVSYVCNRAKNQAAKRMGGNWQIKEYFFESRKPLTDREQQLLFQGVKDYGHNFKRISATKLNRRTPGELRRAYALLHTQLYPPRYDYKILHRVNQATRAKLPKQQDMLIVPEENVFDFLN